MSSLSQSGATGHSNPAETIRTHHVYRFRVNDGQALGQSVVTKSVNARIPATVCRGERQDGFTWTDAPADIGTHDVHFIPAVSDRVVTVFIQDSDHLTEGMCCDSFSHWSCTGVKDTDRYRSTCCDLRMSGFVTAVFRPYDTACFRSGRETPFLFC